VGALARHRAPLALATLRRHPLRTGLAVLGIGVAAALLLDMVMLATGMRTSFRALLLTRGYQLRVAPKGTLPFDSEALLGGAGALVTALRAHPQITAVSPALGMSLGLPEGPLPSVFTLGLEGAVQGDYALEAGRDLPSGDVPPFADATAPAVIHAVANAAFLQRTGRRLGDTLPVASGVDAQLRSEARRARVVLAGVGRFFYVPAETPVLALPLPAVRALAGEGAADRLSLLMAGVSPGDSATVEAVRAWIAATFPQVQAISTETAIRQVEERLSYFRQLAFVLGAVSLAIGALLVATLVTLSVNERRGEIAVLRAIGTPRGGVVAQVMLEGLLLSAAGIVLGMGLGVVTARGLNGILHDFPGLPASFDFFVWSPGAAWRALGMLVAAGTVAGAVPAWQAGSVPIARALREEAVG
jgi:putative ABC transport system permease protein